MTVEDFSVSSDACSAAPIMFLLLGRRMTLVGGCGLDGFEEVGNAWIEGVAAFDDEGCAHASLSEVVGHAVTGDYGDNGDVDGIDGLLGGCGVGAAVLCPLGGLGVHVLDGDVESVGSIFDG